MWVRHQIAVHTGIFVRFQFTHPCGCDLVRHPIATMQRVSIHAPVWVRHPIAAPIGFFVKFQFTHPCGCDTSSTVSGSRSSSFNSRTRVGATPHCRLCGKSGHVSIHAPVWVRRASFFLPAGQFRFQFTHPCGCDTLMDVFYSLMPGFNSRTRVGATGTPTRGAENRPVSIHAPVWVRQSATLPDFDEGVFQFTHPCGCDYCAGRKARSVHGFNSRTRVGATLPGGGGVPVNPVSIHAPVWVRRS